MNVTSFEMNKFMKLLAIVGFLGLIPSVAGGLLGMNVAGKPMACHTSLALEFGADEDEAIAALLHDAIEDAPKELGDQAAAVVRGWIGLKFGRRVLALVEACTDADTRDAEGNKPPWRARKIAYVEALGHKCASECLISAADKLHNARAILRDFRSVGDALWTRFNKEAGRDGTIGYYRGLATAFDTRAHDLQDPRVTNLAKELEEVVGELEREAGAQGVWPPV